MSTVAGTAISQYEKTCYPCQVWKFSDADTNGYFMITNKNSGLALDIENESTLDGANAIQQTVTGNNSQKWSISMTSDGYFNLVNGNSSKYLEVFSNLSTNGAAIGQWGTTGYACQEWTLEREGIQ